MSLRYTIQLVTAETFSLKVNLLALETVETALGSVGNGNQCLGFITQRIHQS